MEGLNARNCAIGTKVDTVKARIYDDLSGRIIYTLFFQHHAKRVNAVGDNDNRTDIIIAIENGGPQNIGQAKTRTDICN